MGILSGILTFGLVLSSVLLILLILVQLPKKEAGGGLAFGGGASQAVLGAGAGNALTRMTRNLTVFFLSVALLNSVLVSRIHDGKGDAAIEEALEVGGASDEVLDIDALLSEGVENEEAANGGSTEGSPLELSVSSDADEANEPEEATGDGDVPPEDSNEEGSEESDEDSADEDPSPVPEEVESEESGEAPPEPQQ